MKSLIIKEMQGDDQPRQKLQTLGPSYLSDAELLAIILRTGNRKLSAIGLAQYVLNACGGSISTLARKSIGDLTTISGIGPAKAIEIKAALELGKRKIAENNLQSEVITCSKDAYWAISSRLMDLHYEEFWVILCNRANKIMDKVCISSGGMHGTVVDMKMLMKTIIQANAVTVVIAHNHPSGNRSPSEEDKALTRKIKESCRLMDVQLLDHIIVAGHSFTSFADEGWL
ncbi:MAG TPA: DNA repair protein RadC [Saprospiraceae bacterium]|jgi:DNA repair protein RadC|nr:DNA repair protein RadC [Saprospiraceae bacterium]